MRRRNGFTLLELLVVVAIIAILASIGVVNYLNAISRARQKRTMADIKLIASAWEARAADTRRYNAAGQAFAMPSNSVTHDEVAAMLAPTYLRTFPTADAWGNALQFALDQPLGARADAAAYAIRSPGRDGAFSVTYATPGPTTDFDCDIVYANGQFVVWPESAQK
jgi:type II secretion system protein G